MRYSDLGIANIPDFLAPGWNTKDISGFVFDEQFQLEGIPLSWFLKRMLCAHTIPPQLNVKQKIEMYLQRQTPAYTAADTVRNSLLRRVFSLNERAKTKLGKQPEYSSDKKILFLTYLDHIDPKTGTVFRLQEVLNKFERNSHLKPFVLAASPQSQPFFSFRKQKSANPFSLLYDYITPEIKRKAQQESALLSSKWRDLNEKTKEQLFPAPLWNAVRGIFDFYISKEYLYHLFVYYKTSIIILQEQNIRAIVITSQHSIFERCINAAGHKLQCPLVLLQHGAGMGSINPHLLEPYITAVFSQRYKQDMERLGIPAKNIAIVGPVIFDEIYSFLKKKGDNPQKRSNSLKSSRILILTVPFIEQSIFTRREYFGYLEKIVRESMAVARSVIIKLHPRERYYTDYKHLTQKLKLPDVTVIQNNPRKCLYHLLSQSDLIINFSSTSAVESMIFDRLIFTVTFPNFSNPFNEVLHASKATVELSIEKNFTKAITEILLNVQIQENLQQQRRIFVNEYCGRIDGKASERMIALIEKVATFKNNTRFRSENV